MKAATRNFKADTVLGEGGFGKVYKGWVDERTMNPVKTGLGMVIAVKKLNPESMQGLEEWQVIADSYCCCCFFLALLVNSVIIDLKLCCFAILLCY